MLRTGNRLLGAVWFQPVRAGVARLHLAIQPLTQGRWVTPRSLRYLAVQCRASGLHTILASPIKAHEALVARVGFVYDPNTWYWTLPLYAHEFPQSPSGSGTAAT